MALVSEYEAAFLTIDRWHHVAGELGEGIRRLLDAGAQVVAGELEAHWRSNFDGELPFDEATRAAQLAHAHLVIDDVIAVARAVHGADPPHRLLVERMLGLRLFAGWCGYTLEMNTRLGLPIPVLGGPALASPEYSLR